MQDARWKTDKTSPELWMAKIREEDLKEGGLVQWRPSGLVQQGHLHSAQTVDGQEEMDPSREICRGHQRVLSPWSKKERERERERETNILKYFSENNSRLKYLNATNLLNPNKSTFITTVTLISWNFVGTVLDKQQVCVYLQPFSR